MIIYLVPIGHGRYELYSEAPEEPEVPPAQPEGFVKATLHRLRVAWNEMVKTARHREDTPRGRFARWRDDIVSKMAESIAEQRALWALRHGTRAAAVYPADLDADGARAILDRALANGRRHHLKWLIIDAILFVLSGLLMLIPGPNFIAYYFAFRLFGHYFSWRGAVQGLDCTTWTMEAEPALVELATLADVSREARRSHVEAIATRLNLPRLAAFFDRTAVPAA